MTNDELRALIDARVARMTPEDIEYERKWQAISWAYGNLACSTNHRPVRAAFKKIALERGISEAEFDAWCRGKVWLDDGRDDVCDTCKGPCAFSDDGECYICYDERTFDAER